MENQNINNQMKIIVEDANKPTKKRWIILFFGAALAVMAAGVAGILLLVAVAVVLT